MNKKPNYAEMFTLRKDGRYQGYYRELDKNGERKGRRHVVCDRDPEKLYRKLLEKENEIPPKYTFDDAADAWEEKHWDRIGSKTAETYTAPLRRIRDKFSGYDADEVTAQAIQAFLAELGRQGFARRSVQMHRDVLNMIFNNAILEGKLTFNPVVAVSMPRNLPAKKQGVRGSSPRWSTKTKTAGKLTKTTPSGSFLQFYRSFVWFPAVCSKMSRWTKPDRKGKKGRLLMAKLMAERHPAKAAGCPVHASFSMKLAYSRGFITWTAVTNSSMIGHTSSGFLPVIVRPKSVLLEYSTTWSSGAGA